MDNLESLINGSLIKERSPRDSILVNEDNSVIVEDPYKKSQQQQRITESIFQNEQPPVDAYMVQTIMLICNDK